MDLAADPYGWLPQTQPSASPVPEHAPGTPEPTMRTAAPAGTQTRAPLMFIVGLVAIVVVLSQVTVRGTVDVKV